MILLTMLMAALVYVRIRENGKRTRTLLKGRVVLRLRPNSAHSTNAIRPADEKNVLRWPMDSEGRDVDL